MKRYFAFLFVCMLLLVSCGTESGRFRIEGRLKNMNQAEFYIYSLEGGNPRLDTISVADGRFIYETDLERQGTYVLLYPNFSEQVIFGESGATVEVEGDASHLKDTQVTGTAANDDMTAWRMNANRLTPPEVKKSAVDYIRENPGSVISSYLLSRYLLLGDTPDYKTASELLLLMLKEQPENGRLIRLKKQIAGLQYYREGQQLPSFSATDINGKRVSRESLKAELNVVCVWALWNYESQSMMRKLNSLKHEYGGRLAIVSICVEASPKTCRDFVERDSMRWSHVCDGLLWESPIVQQLGIANIPGNLLIDQKGKILAVDVKNSDLDGKVKSFLK